MEQRKKIDETLTERHTVLRLLKSLKKDDISLAEMEEIGLKLQKSGKRALPPLVRQLWREQNSDLISRYTYLLDFFDDDVWLDQLVQIAIKRKDLDDEAKEALFVLLDECGIDVSGPPFSQLPSLVGSSFRTTLPKLLDRGEEGLVCFVEDVLALSPESRREIILDLPATGDPRIPTLMEILLSIGEPGIRLATVTALGRARDPQAARMLHGLLDDGDEQVRIMAVRSLRRLAFIGIDTAPPSPDSPPLPFHAAYAGPFDGSGCRILWLARYAADGCLAAIFLQLHEAAGVKAAWGSRDITPEQFDRYLADAGCDDALFEVGPDYALALIRDAVYRTGENGALLPAEFYVWRSFAPSEIAAVPHDPLFPRHDLALLGRSRSLVADSGALFDDDVCAGWGMDRGRVYDYAEEWLEREKSGGVVASWLDSLLDRFSEELLVPATEQLRRRLLLTADLIRETGKGEGLLERALAAAASLDSPSYRNGRHPFFRRLALESLALAREALAEGYDLRQYDSDDDWEL